jgi:hypothetical protein
LPSGDSGKIIRGSEFETEFDNIATAIATKADAADPTFTGTVTIDGLTVNGNTTLGNAATDTVTVTADIASNLIPSADDTYNLGASGAEWNDLYVDGTAYIDAIDFNGTAITATGTEINYLDITTLGTVEASKAVTADANGDVTFGDNDKAKFGAGSDLQIYHDGGNSRIYDQGTGALVMRSNQLNIQSPTGEKLAIFNQDNDVELYYDDSLKLATTNTGIDVTGSISADGLTVSSATDATITVADATLPTIQKLDLIHNAGSSTLISGNNGAYGSFTIQADDNANVINRFQINAGGDVSLYEDTGTTAKLFWDASAESLGIGTSSPDALLEINKGSEGEYLKVGGDNISNGRALTFTSSASSSGSVGALHTIKSNSVSGEIAFANGDGTIMYLKDGGNVGIGTSSPATMLELAAADNDGTDAPRLRITNSSTTLADGARVGTLEFHNSDTTGSGPTTASIEAITNATDERKVELTFNPGFNGATTEAMRIDSSGNLLVGTTDTNVSDNTTGGGININGDGEIKAAKNGTVLNLNRLTTDGEIIRFKKGGTTTVGSIGTSSGTLYFLAQSNGGFRLDSDGNAIRPCTTSGSNRDNTTNLGGSTARWKDLYLSGGAYLGGVAAANKLDDYEEGTHETTATPETSGTITLESNTDTLSYTKVGRLVTVFGRITVDSVSSPVGDGVDITLPFSVASLSEDADFSAGAVAYFHPTNGHSLLPFVATPSLSNKLRIHVDASTIAASHQFRFMISYQTT